MYLQYFGLRDKPFTITPDPAFVYMSPRHQEALGHLLYGTGEDGGFVQLTGEVGTGKTTLIRTLLMQDIPQLDVALILNPRLTAVEFLQSVCDELHAPYAPESNTLKPLVDALNAHLLQRHAEGRRTVLIVDEAQNLSRDLLEQIRLLTNLETHKEKLLRIMLIGQPELRDMLMRDDLRQLAQRITARCHLEPLSRAEVTTYVTHRIQVAGGHPDLFTPAALRAVSRVTRGIPRLINIVCDRALLGAYSQNLRHVDRRTLLNAADEVLDGTIFRGSFGRYRVAAWSALVATGMALGVGITALQKPVDDEPDAVVEIPAGSTASAETASGHAPAEAEPTSKPDVAAAQASDLLPAVSEPEPMQPPKSEPKPPRYPSLQVGLPMLAADWGVATPTGKSQSCRSLPNHGLHCFNSRGSWKDLVSYDLPALIQLKDGAVLLRQIQGEKLQIETPAGIEQWSLSEVKSAFTNRFLLLWRPALGETIIGGASSTEAVMWLDQQLRLDEGGAASAFPPHQRFDESMVERVKQFQRRHRLKPDGRVGARTLILLSQQAADTSRPRLRAH